MALITGSEVLAKCLEGGGEELFFIMDGPMLLAEATYVTEGIRMIDVRPEQAAVFMGQAYNRLRQEKPYDLLRRPMNIEYVQQ